MDVKHIYINHLKKHLIIFKGLYDDENEYSILSQGDTELESWINAFMKISGSYEKISELLFEINELIAGDTVPDKIYSNLVSSTYIETNPENPCHSNDVRTNTRLNAVFYDNESDQWGFLSR